MVECDASKVLRNKRHISRSSDDVLMLHLQVEGTSLQTQNDQVCTLNPGDLAICHSNEPYTLFFDQRIKMIVVKIPCSLVRNHILNPEQLAGLHIAYNQGISNLLIEHIKQIWALHDQINDASYNHSEIGNTISSLLAMTVQETYPKIFCTSENNNETKIIRLKNYIQNNLSDPGLCPSLIAQANGISPRYMRKIFGSEKTTCSKQINNLRIDRIAHELKDVKNIRTCISQIAFKWGFNNVSHFNRAFKEIKGMNPRDYRNQQMSKVKLR